MRWPPRRTAAWARSPRCGATRPSTPCVIPEPTGFDVVCAQAGALTFTGVVHGRAAHAAERLHGVSAIDRYLPIHAALAELEARAERRRRAPADGAAGAALPARRRPRAAGEWSSSVPDRLVFEGRAPVRVGEESPRRGPRWRRRCGGRARATGWPVELAWTGGQFASAQTPADGGARPRRCAGGRAVLGRARALGRRAVGRPTCGCGARPACRR